MPHFGLRFLFIYLFNIILLITYLYCFCHNSFLYVCCFFFFLLFLFFILFFIFIFFLCVCFHHFFRYIFFFKSKCTISLHRNRNSLFQCMYYNKSIDWLVGCFGFNGPLRQYFSLYRAVSQREGERKEKR